MHVLLVLLRFTIEYSEAINHFNATLSTNIYSWHPIKINFVLYANAVVLISGKTISAAACKYLTSVLVACRNGQYVIILKSS